MALSPYNSSFLLRFPSSTTSAFNLQIKKALILLSLIPGHSISPVGSLNSVHTAVNGSFITYTEGNGTLGKKFTPWHRAYSNYGVLGMGRSTVRRKTLESHWIAVAMIDGLAALKKRSSGS